MVERKRRKKNKVRGERTHGKGDTKNNRGGGSRGGRGRAGVNKGKFASLGRLNSKKYKLKPRVKGKSISLGELNDKLDELVRIGKIINEGELFIIDSKSGFEKILSQGSITKKLDVRIKVSEKAREKILSIGGLIKDTDIEFSE